MKQVRFIYASTPNGVIGLNGGLPWKLPEDMQYFKGKTLHQTVMMGANTYDSLPASFKPLPNRKSVIVTSRPDEYKKFGTVTDDPIKYLRQAKEDVWVIGGASLYRQLEHLCTEVCHTEVFIDTPGDAYFDMDKKGWSIVMTTGILESKTGINYRITEYKKPCTLVD